MDHKAAYAHHVAQAIRHKKAMGKGEEAGADDALEAPGDEGEEFLSDAEESEAPLVDDKAKRKARLRGILAR